MTCSASIGWVGVCRYWSPRNQLAQLSAWCGKAIIHQLQSFCSLSRRQTKDYARTGWTWSPSHLRLESISTETDTSRKLDIGMFFWSSTPQGMLRKAYEILKACTVNHRVMLLGRKCMIHCESALWHVLLPEKRITNQPWLYSMARTCWRDEWPTPASIFYLSMHIHFLVTL